MRLITLVIATAMLLYLTAGPAAGQDPKYSREGADSCLSCHEEDVVLVLFKGAHANPTDPNGPFGHGQLQCEACHGPSGDHAGRVRRGQERPSPGAVFGSDSPTPVDTQNGLCMDCHTSDTGFGWHGSDHDINEIACTDCHTSHTAQDPVLVTSTQPEVCFDCHQGCPEGNDIAFPTSDYCPHTGRGCSGARSGYGSPCWRAVVRIFACYHAK